MGKKYIIEFENPDNETRLEEYCEFLNYLRKYRKKKAVEVTPEGLIKGATVQFLDLQTDTEYRRKNEDYKLISEVTEIGYWINPDKKIKNKFKQFLKDSDMSMTELANRTHIAKSQLSQILNNKTQPGLDYFIRIYMVLGAPPLSEIIYRE